MCGGGGLILERVAGVALSQKENAEEDVLILSFTATPKSSYVQLKVSIRDCGHAEKPRWQRARHTCGGGGADHIFEGRHMSAYKETATAAP